MSMKWYHFMQSEDNALEPHYFGGQVVLCGVDPYNLQLGERVGGWHRNSWIRSLSQQCDGPPDDSLWTCEALLVFSSRLQETFRRDGIGKNDIQWLPIRVLKSTGEDIPGFSIVNIVSRVPALDIERSTLVSFDEHEIDRNTNRPKVTGVWSYALFDDELIGHDVVRLQEFSPSVFVSERFAEAFARLKCSGAEFAAVPTRSRPMIG